LVSLERGVSISVKKESFIKIKIKNILNNKNIRDQKIGAI